MKKALIASLIMGIFILGRTGFLSAQQTARTPSSPSS